MKVLDANGKELGVMITSNFLDQATIFIPSLNKFVGVIGSDLSSRQSVFFINLNCSGTPYMNEGAHPNLYQIRPIAPGNDYVIDPASTPSAIDFQSRLDWNNTTQNIGM